jgi:hypothetical protein
MVSKADYRTMYDQALGELREALDRQEALDTEREQLDARISQLKQGIMALGPLCGEQPHTHYPELLPEYSMFNVGLKEAVLKVVALAHEGFVTAVTVRDTLPNVGYEVKSKNILPSIHNVLKRLVETNDVEMSDVNGKTGYRLKADRITIATNPLQKLKFPSPNKPYQPVSMVDEKGRPKPIIK